MMNSFRFSSITNPVVIRMITLLVIVSSSCLVASAKETESARPVFHAGAAAIDITPTKYPVIVNGYFNERTANSAIDSLMSRAVVLDDGKIRLAIVVVDNLMIRRDLLDTAKQIAHDATGIPIDRMLISATHSHTAPSAMGCLGSGADADYQRFLVGKIAESIIEANKKIVPAQAGWAVIKDEKHNHCRRWIFRPDRMQTDPFGERNIRAHMHPGYQSKNHIGPSGPADTDLSLLSIQTLDGKPLAVLANYAMHFYGSTPVSGDFCTRFGDRLAELIGVKSSGDGFVGMMSQGTSGDSMWMDYSQPAPKRDLDKYTLEVAKVAHQAYQSIKYQSSISLAMAETKLKLRRRVPDEKRLAWAKSVMAELGDRIPKSKPEIYAREAIYLHEEPVVELKLQAVRIGELGITTLPNEVYGITGMKLKLQSPLTPTFNIELANGAQGYIPPPEQHALGGYTTWPARTAGLEVEAEPKIVAALLELLEKVAEKPRRKLEAPPSAYSKAVLASKPVAYWRMNELSGTGAVDLTGKHHGVYEQRVAFCLPAMEDLSGAETEYRAAHFAGGRMQVEEIGLGENYSVELWFWNGLPFDARPVTGYFFSIGKPGDQTAAGDHLGIGGTHQDSLTAGKLIFFNGNEKDQMLAGYSSIPLKMWNHVALIREGKKVTVYLNGNDTPEFTGEVEMTHPESGEAVFLGGRNDGFANLEGKIAEVAIYNRVLKPEEITTHYQAVRPDRRKTTKRPPVKNITEDIRVGAAAVDIESEDSMVIAGGIFPRFVKGQEGKLRAVAVVVEKPSQAKVAIVQCDVLFVERGMMDAACAEIEKSTGIPAANILINATHTHHAPSTTFVHGYGRDDLFCERLKKAVIVSVQKANDNLKDGEATFSFYLGEENTVGANSRLMMPDGKIRWIGTINGAVRPTGPFDPQLPVLAFRGKNKKLRALIYNHSTHTIGTRKGNVRSAGFYGLAAQELEKELGGVVSFLEGASGSTHNINRVSTAQAVDRFKVVIKDALNKAEPRAVDRLAVIKRPFTFSVRVFDEQVEDQKVVSYCKKYSGTRADDVIKVFRDMRTVLKPQQGKQRETWLQVMLIGDVAIVGVPAEYFTGLGVEIKKRSPFKNTYVAELANDWIGYLPDVEAHQLGGYQTWMGLHSYAELGTGERVVDEVVKMLEELKQ